MTMNLKTNSREEKILKKCEKTSYSFTACGCKLDNLLVIFLLLLVNGGLGNTIQITLTALGDPSATLLFVNLDNANLLKGLENAAVDLAGGVNVVGGAGAAVLGGSVNLAETADTNGLAEVDVTSDSGGANVEPIHPRSETIIVWCKARVDIPVSVLGRELVGSGGLDSVDPTCSSQIASFVVYLL